MRQYKWRVPVVGVFTVASCTSQPAPRYTLETLPEVVVLRVDRVDVSAVRPGTQDRWDGPAPEPGVDEGCLLLALVTGLASPVVGEGMDLLCGLASKQPQLEREPANPDLQLRLNASLVARLESFVEPDALTYVFEYEFLIPTKAIPREGIRLEVLDADAGQDGEIIGAARISANTLAEALSSEAGLIDLPAGAAQHIELVVAPYEPLKIVKTRMSASEKPRELGLRPLVAGEIVTLKAEGSYTVGGWFDATIGPEGYPKGEARSYNFKQEPFVSAAHASSIALIRRGKRVQGAVVGSGAEFNALYAGPLSVGLNDADPTNNSGWISFEGSTRAPTPDEWTGR